uniref:Rab GTPase-binding effector protein 2 n=1 Tax=Salarias fasciatus TaxID=181472 RepID=A0A672F894_SALFA
MQKPACLLPFSRPDASLQAQLADCRAQVEHWQGVATICELSKQEELAELQKQCDQEIQSLQEALRETAAQYEARIAVLQSQSLEFRRASGQSTVSVFCFSESISRCARLTNSLTEGEATERTLEAVPETEGASPPTEGYFSLRNCDSASLSSFSLDTPSLPRRLHAQEDTDSLVSTGTLVPEAIYLPPAGHRLVTHHDWDALNAQLSELRGEASRLQAEKEELEKELDAQTNQTHKQVSMLQAQVQSSEALLQDLQKSFSQSQNAVQSRLAELSMSQRKVCSELSRLKGEEVEDDCPSLPDTDLISFPFPSAPKVNERLECSTLTLFVAVCVVQFSSLKTETERIQAQRDEVQAELLACRTELEGLRVALSHLQGTNKSLSGDKAALQQQCLELRSQVISLRSQVDTSQTVQRDFVQLSQSLQVKLEVIRQAETLEQVKKILEGEVGEAASLPADIS